MSGGKRSTGNYTQGLRRGQADGSMRPDLAVMDVYAKAVAMAFHFVSNRSTFSAIFEQGSDPAQVEAARRACIQNTNERQVVVLDRSGMRSVAPAS